MNKKLKLGMVTVHPHGQPWSEVLRGSADAEITHVWDYNFHEAVKFADRYRFPIICKTPEEMIGKVDAIIIPGGRPLPLGATDSVWSQTEPMGMQPSQHLELAQPFLEAGIPTLIDKPLAGTMEEAKGIIAAASRGGALLMSCSAQRYDQQLLAAKEIINCGGLGPVRAVNIVLGTGPTDLVWYVIHGIEGIATMFGTDVESVTAVTGNTSIDQGGHKLPYATSFILKYRSGPIVSLMLLREKAKREETEKLWPLDYIPPLYLTLYYQYQIYGDLDHMNIRVVGKAYYFAMIRSFIESVKSGNQPIPNEEMLEITRLLLSLPMAVQYGGIINPQNIN
jgi:predicted dehydrogenase